MGWQLLVLGTILTGISSLSQASSNLIWRHAQTGEQYQHPLSQTQLQPGSYLPQVKQPWQLAARGDFNGDGHPDLFWQHASSGQTAFQWLVQGNHRQFSDFISVSSGWQVAASGDLDGDRIEDLIWYHPESGQYYLWLLDAQGLKADAPLFQVTDPGWQLAFARDFDGDGKADLLFRHQTSGANYLFFMDATRIQAQQEVLAVRDLNWQLVASADLNADNRADLIWRHRQSGLNYGFYMQGAQVQTQVELPRVADTNWQLRAVEDLDGDGQTDQLWWHAQNAQLVALRMNGTQILSEHLLLTAEPDWQLLGLNRSQPSYLAKPAKIPGRIEAEHYDRDGPDLAFHDTDDRNEGDASFRADGVDIEATNDQGGGFNIGYIGNGEWLQYSVKVTKTGQYRLRLRVAGESVTGQLHLEQNGQNLTGPVALAPTGGWQTWQSIESAAFTLQAGEQQLKLVFDTGLFNLNYFELVEVTEDNPANGEPQLLLSENFDNATLPTSLAIGGSKAELVQTADSFGGTGQSLKATYPAQAANEGGGYLWSGFDLSRYQTDNVYIRFRAKMPKLTHGVKFVKVFGQHPTNSPGYANTTFGLDYTGVDAGLGSLNVVSFGDGSETENDTQNTLFLDGSYPQGVGRSYQLPGYAVSTPQNQAWRASDWGTDWHLFEFHVKFNSGDSATTEKNDGSFSVKIDGKTYVDAKGLFNRHFSNPLLDRIEILGWSQTPRDQAIGEFELWYDNIEISLNGFMPDTTPPSTPQNLSSTQIASHDLSLNWQAANDNLLIREYQILLNGKLVGTSQTTSFKVENLQPATQYRLSLIAIDTSGNSSEASQPLLITTLPESTSGSPLRVRVTGLDIGASLQLTDNGESLNIQRNGWHQFSQPRTEGAQIAASLSQQPRNQQCRLAHAEQQVAATGPDSILVDCSHPVQASLQIAADNLAPWSLKVLHGAKSLRHQAYPGIRYESRIGVTGGVFPYEFRVQSLTRNGSAVDESEVQIDFRRGLVSWTPTEPGSYLLKIGIQDSNAAGVSQLSQEFPIEVDASGFRFVSPDGQDIASAGSHDKPYQTLGYALAQTKTDQALYVRSGRYLTGGFRLDSSTTASLLAYPDEVATLDLNHKGIGFSGDTRLTRVEGFEFANMRQYGFGVDAASSGLVIRNNRFLNGREFNDGEEGDRGRAENPSFIFTVGDSASRHFGMMIQDNVFGPFQVRRWLAGDGTLRSSGGAAMVLYDTVDTLVENNLVDCGTAGGISDKDNSVRNTIRENMILDRDSRSSEDPNLAPIDRSWLNLDAGLNLMAQDNAKDLHIHHNLLENSNILLGVQCFQTSCSMQNIYLHHNTLTGGGIHYSWGAFEPLSSNFHTHYNLLVSGNQAPYGAIWSSNQPSYAQKYFNHNLLQTSTSRTLQGDGSAASIERSDWQNSFGFDKDSIFTASSLIEGQIETAGLPLNHPGFGRYGHRY